jgi:insulysin
MQYLHPSSSTRKKLSVHLKSQYQGVKFDPQRAMPMIQAFFMQGIPVSQEKFMVLMASQPGVTDIQAFARDCLDHASELPSQNRAALEGMIDDLSSMVAVGEESGALLRETNTFITNIAAFKAGLELSPPPHGSAE